MALTDSHDSASHFDLGTWLAIGQPSSRPLLAMQVGQTIGPIVRTFFGPLLTLIVRAGKVSFEPSLPDAVLQHFGRVAMNPNITDEPWRSRRRPYLRHRAPPSA